MLRSLLIKTVTFLAIAKLLPGFHVSGLGAALWMAIIYGVMSTLLALLVGVTLIAGLLGLIATMPPLAVVAFLASPAIFFVTDFLVVLGGLSITSDFVSGFSMNGNGTAFQAALILALVSAICTPPREVVVVSD